MKILAVFWVVLFFLFFAIYSTLSLRSYSNAVPLFNSPDETANYFFSKQFALHSALGYQEPLLKASNAYVHPRSMTAVDEQVVPVGFLGLPVLYGLLAKIFGIGALPFFTPFFASITALFFYILLRSIFSKPVAVVSALLLLMHPAYVYNANRAMLPNVLFIDLLIIGSALIVCAVQKKNILGGTMLGVCAGCALGASVWVRFSESPWVFGLLLAWGIIVMRSLRLNVVLAFLSGMALPLGLMLFFNAHVYGNPLLFGYQTASLPNAVAQLESSGSVFQNLVRGDMSAAFQQSLPILKALKHALVPFGIQKEIFIKTFLDYGVFFFIPFTILALFGFFVAVRNALSEFFFQKKVGQLLWIISAIALSAWLIVFYGSWVFHDNLDREVTIGTSYLRYWLPMFIVTLPFGASLLVAVYGQARGYVSRVIVLSMVSSLAIFSFASVFTGSSESITAMQNEITFYHAKREFITNTTPPNAVIVSARSDKIFFPDRKVAEQTSDFRELELMKNVMGEAPVYYYGLWNKEDAAYISKKYFTQYGLALEFVADADEREHLYRVIGERQ